MAKARQHSATAITATLPEASGLSGFDSLLERSVSQVKGAVPSGLLTGRIAAFSAEGVPAVECSALSPNTAVPAASLVPLDSNHVGRRVALMCADSDPGRPVILGLLAIDPVSLDEKQSAAPQTSVCVDGKSVTLSASEEIVLKCGKASIVLTRAGKVLIRGAYLSSLSTGVNRVKGGVVQIN